MAGRHVHNNVFNPYDVTGLTTRLGFFDYCTDVTDVLTRLSFPSLRFRPSVFENYHEDTPRSKQHGRSVFQRCRFTAHLGVNQYLYSSLSIY